ncbi:MAG: CBS domain-containing protein [Stellaceae bacterium]
MKVSDVMTRGVISLAPGDSMLKAARLMMQYGVSGFPVLSQGKLVGIITQGDFLRRAEIATERLHARSNEVSLGQLAEEYARAHGRKVGEVMTRDVVTVTADASLGEAVDLMERTHVKRLPVVNGDGLVGLINRVNLLHAFIASSLGITKTPASDADIRDRLTATLAAEPWAPHNSVNIAVSNGNVDLEGVIADERQRLALRIAAENTWGVKGVSDHLRLSHAAA